MFLFCSLHQWNQFMFKISYSVHCLVATMIILLRYYFYFFVTVVLQICLFMDHFIFYSNYTHLRTFCIKFTIWSRFILTFVQLSVLCSTLCTLFYSLYFVLLSVFCSTLCVFQQQQQKINGIPQSQQSQYQ